MAYTAVKRFIERNPERWKELNRKSVSAWQKRQTAWNQATRLLRKIDPALFF